MKTTVKEQTEALTMLTNFHVELSAVVKRLFFSEMDQSEMSNRLYELAMNSVRSLDVSSMLLEDFVNKFSSENSTQDIVEKTQYNFMEEYKKHE